MQTFTPRELKLVRRLKTAPVLTIFELCDPCPIHSVCIPLPLFSVHREDDDSFSAEWNTHHKKGPRQIFRFEEIGGLAAENS